MIKELCVIGHPTTLGGADTELFHQIKCWVKMGIKVYICHTAPITTAQKNINLESLYGCIYLHPRQWNEIAGMHCISFCNGEFISNIHHIKKHAKTTTFVNCMTYNFQKEIAGQAAGLIDFHLYQTKHAFEKISKNMQHLGTYRPIMIHPYFDASEFPYHANRPNDHFRFGRISRCDMMKFSTDQLSIYDNINSPVLKSGLILGWDNRIKTKLKVQPSDIILNNKTEIYKKYIQLVKANTITQQEFYNFCDVMILQSDTFENLPRVGMEAMASGSIMIVDNRGGWTLEVDNGKTGFLCN